MVPLIRCEHHHRLAHRRHHHGRPRPLVARVVDAGRVDEHFDGLVYTSQTAPSHLQRATVWKVARRPRVKACVILHSDLGVCTKRDPATIDTLRRYVRNDRSSSTIHVRGGRTHQVTCEYPSGLCVMRVSAAKPLER